MLITSLLNKWLNISIKKVSIGAISLVTVLSTYVILMTVWDTIYKKELFIVLVKFIVICRANNSQENEDNGHGRSKQGTRRINRQTTV